MDLNNLMPLLGLLGNNNNLAELLPLLSNLTSTSTNPVQEIIEPVQIATTKNYFKPILPFADREIIYYLNLLL